jgi:hypothetical protein
MTFHVEIRYAPHIQLNDTWGEARASESRQPITEEVVASRIASDCFEANAGAADIRIVNSKGEEIAMMYAVEYL